VAGELGQDLAEIRLAEDQHMIEALTAERAGSLPACPGQ
jgi:hypothetical protein